MRIAICDDEKEICSQLKRMVLKQRADCEVCLFDSGKQLLQSRQRFSVILMDIQMEGMSGIETAKALRMKDENAVLIFVTALKEYVFDAFDVSAFHYLLKPVSDEKFSRVFESACREAERRQQEAEEQIFFRTRTRSFTLLKKDILYVESRGRKVDIHTVKECVTVYGTMNGMQEQLGGNFYRCHRGYLVNLTHVAEYEPDKILLGSGETVFMARDKYGEFVKAYMRFLEKGGIVHG
ncbi:MAG: LytTR family DNA-binding domain-containing protein [Butyrivibrio sp.]|nr:LytTR family DNA-binding domain-containing protein [Acetatifactor muris]MCM1558296.1 LytTR family DNA-binding domain-containing protein [Butyrivibrio sp.]